MEARSLGSASLTGNNFSLNQRLAQQIITVTASSVSIIAGCISLHWFFRMRTTFRHYLIILLVCSDLFKATWYLISASVELGTHSRGVNQSFCQASGFFLALGIEASDFAILVIAIHSALCIFRPRTSLGESGLYSVRYLVYALWIIVPVIMASLGLMHGGVYIDSGSFCYLPIRPFWYRLGLAWIPRYVVFITILFLYIRIYWFVSSKFKQFEQDSHGSHKQPSDHLTFHGKGAANNASVDASPFRSGWTGFGENADVGPSKQEGVISPDRPAESEDPLDQVTKISSWESYTFGDSRSPLPPPNDDEIVPAPAHRPRDSAKNSASTEDTAIPGERPRGSPVSLATALWETAPDMLPIDPKLPPAAANNRKDENKGPSKRNTYINSGLQARHTAIKRQLRFLFIYPIAYLISWLVPLAQHLSLYWDSVAAHPIYGLACASTLFLALQCAIDSAIFSYRETPWRYLQRDAPAVENSGIKSSTGSSTAVDRGPSCWDILFCCFQKQQPDGEQHQNAAESDEKTAEEGRVSSVPPQSPVSNRSSASWRLNFRSNANGGAANPAFSGSTTGLSEKNPFAKRAGKSKAEMVAEARAARMRRDLEVTTAQQGREQLERKRKMSLLRRGGAERSWWEVEGRKRKDSVLLGTDSEATGNGKDRAGSVAAAGKERANSMSQVVEEGTSHAEEAGDSSGNILKKMRSSGSNSSREKESMPTVAEEGA